MEFEQVTKVLEKEPHTVQDFVDIWTRFMGDYYYLYLRKTGKMSGKRAQLIIDQATQEMYEKMDKSLSPELKEALEKTVLPFPNRNNP